ncbi:hypothetical protein RHGRI_030281 [Rhododendron griersonianum]|uniref:EamA domain-containing protein n=1 Tax=Rhododendron griersonianum TaxID=479676 RepID=A0AAV6IMH6_9ERIC|nr:hypothetical protein RHGRI_030281 [Rhododendron griersonianum]
MAMAVSLSPLLSPSIPTTTRNYPKTLLNRSNSLTINLNRVKFTPNCASKDTQLESPPSTQLDCVGTGTDVECDVGSEPEDPSSESPKLPDELSLVGVTWEWGLLVSPFFFWGTAMVAMKEVLPKTGPFFVSSFRLIPAGVLLVGFAAARGRPLPSGVMAWLSISLFALGFLAEGLERTSAGLGSYLTSRNGLFQVIIDSQPLTVAVLASLLFGETIGFVGAAGLVLGVIGLLLLEVPALSLNGSNFSLWGSGEWWMLLAAQSMAVGTVMVRWVSKYSDPIMATGWHMVIGGLPLVVISFLNHDPALNGSFMELTSNDLLALLYTSLFGSAISYGVYFYNATRGRFLYLGETFAPVQLVGAVVTLAAIYMVNYRNSLE